MNEILTMNSRSPRRKFVFFCCVTLLKLIDKKTFGINMDSPQGQESKRISLFYKVKEGMFIKKLLRDPRNSFCNLCHNLFVLNKIYSHFAYQVKERNTSYFIRPVLRPPFRKEQVSLVSYHAGRGNA